MKYVFLLCSLISILALLAITIFLLSHGISFIHEIGLINFIFGTKWAPLADVPKYGIFPMIVASLYVTALSVLIGIGVGLLTSVCLFAFCGERMSAIINQMINLLAGIPSVIYGLVGLNVLVPFIRDYISPTGVGYGILSSSLVLAVMILPTIVSVSIDSLVAVPRQYLEGALALGATKEEAIFKIVLPAAKSGVITGAVLAIGRAIGETMAVIMVIGGSPEMPRGIFQSVRTMTANIAMGATELSGNALQALIATGVVLFTFTLLLNVSFSYLKNR